jgi:phenylacetate-CoA ligase
MANAKRAFYDDRETMTAEARKELCDLKVRWIVEHAYLSAPGVRAKMEAAGVAPSDVRSVKDLERIPITTKDDLVRLQKESPPFGGFATAPPNQLGSICMSPGPTYNSPGNDESYRKRVEKAFFGCGLRAGDIVLNTFAYHVSPMGLLLDTPLRQFGAAVIPMGGGNKQLQVQVLKDLKVTAFTGTATFLLEVLQTAEEMGIDPRKDFALRLAVTPLDHGVMKIVEKEYGIRVTEFYGTADVGIVAYNCEARSGMHVCEEVVLEIVDMNTGRQLGPDEVGRVVVTPLDATFPLVRYAPGDLSSWNDQACSCGRTSARLNPLAGWIGHAVKVRGMFVHPSQLASVVAKHPGIERYRLVCRTVDRKDHLTLSYEAREDLPRSEVEQSLARQFRELCRLNLDAVERVAGGGLAADGKPIVDERPQSEK